MPSPGAAAGAPRAAGHGGGRTGSTGAGSGACVRRRLRADEDLAAAVDGELALLIVRRAGEHADAALVLRLVELLGHRPLGAQRVAGAHGFPKTARVLEVRDRRAR